MQINPLLKIVPNKRCDPDDSMKKKIFPVLQPPQRKITGAIKFSHTVTMIPVMELNFITSTMHILRCSAASGALSGQLHYGFILI